MVVALQRVRIRLNRLGQAASALSHLQQIEGIRRSLDKSAWPLMKSEGKRAKPKVSFGPAISVGYESEAEYCDVELISRLAMPGSQEALQKNLPSGYSVASIKSIPRFFPSLDQTLNAASYEIISPLLAGTVRQWEEFSKKDHFMVVKKKESGDVAVDARQCVRSWKLENDRLWLDIRFGPGKTLKPERIMQAVLGLDDTQVEMGNPTQSLKVKRLKLYLEKTNGDLVEP